MVKIKNKKSNLADMYARHRQKQNTKKMTPFEIHVNRNKQNILGQKSKADQGLPGVSRTKAINKRKHTLLHEFKVKDKDNIFLDKRIGEKNKSMTQEDKTMARFAAERMRAHKKKSIFNLNDEEILTHQGQALMDIEKFDDPKSDDDASDDETGKLGNQFVKEAHFGGGMLSKPHSEMSRKDLIDQLIAESKKRKAERQKMKEDTLDLTDKLDAEWKDLLPLLITSKRTPEDAPMQREKPDDYDITVRQLRYDARAIPTDKLKSEENMLKEEKERLEKLEQERIARMDGFVDDNKKKHRSADDLESDYFMENVEEKDDEADINMGINEMESTESGMDKDEEVQSHDGDENNEQHEVDEQYGDENEDSAESQKSSKNDKSEEEDDLSDLKESESSSDDDETIQKEIFELKSDSKNQKNPKSKNEINEEITKLPETYAAPSSFEELVELIQHSTVGQQSTIIERIIKCNHPKLGEGNKEKLAMLFEYLLQYLETCAQVTNVEGVVKLFQMFDKFCPYLYDLAHINPEDTRKTFKEMLLRKHEEFQKKEKKYPGLDLLILFKLAAILFPTSDFRHPIITPCFVFMSQILLRCRVRTRSDISRGLFLCTLILENTLLSKRFAPSVINYLRGIVYVSVPKLPTVNGMKTIPPFKSRGISSNLLVLEECAKTVNCDIENLKMRAADLVTDKINDDFKIRVLCVSMNLISEFGELLEELHAAYSIFQPIAELLATKFLRTYPKSMRKQGKILRKKLQLLKNKPLCYLEWEKKKPKALRLYEPRIEAVHDGKRYKPMSKSRAEREKLLHKLKRETKSAIREVRRDTAFLAKVQIKQQLKSDEERKRKVKEIFGDAAVQQSEFKKLKRQK